MICQNATSFGCSLKADQSQQAHELYLQQLSEESFKSRAHVVIFVLIVGTAGLFTNVLILITFLRRFKAGVVRDVVAFLALLDIVVSVVGVPIQLVTIYHAYATPNVEMCRCSYVFTFIPTHVGGIALVAAACDRLLRTCNPRLPQPKSGPFRVLLGLCSMVFATVLASFAPLYGIHYKDYQYKKLRMCWIDDSFSGTAYLQAYNIFVASFLSFCFILFTFAYFVILRALWIESKISKCKVNVAAIETSLTMDPPSTSTQGPSKSVRNPGEKMDVPKKISSSQPSTETGDTPTLVVKESMRKVSKRVYQESSRRARFQYTQSTLKHEMSPMKSALVLGSISIIYVLTCLPHVILRYSYREHVDWCENNVDCGSNAIAVAYRLYYANAALRVIVYTLLIKPFRQECGRLLRSRVE